MTNPYFNIPPVPNDSFPDFFDNENNSPFMVASEDVSFSENVSEVYAPTANKTQTPSSSEVTLNECQGNELTNEHSILSKKYWMFYYDVDVLDVFERLKMSFFPHKAELCRLFSSNKMDLYGPLWGITTVILVLFIISNIARWNADEKVNFKLLSISACIFYCFALLIPLFYSLIVYLTRKFFSQFTPSTTPDTSFHFFHLLILFICYLGYSLICFIPLSLFLLIPSLLVSSSSSARKTLFYVFSIIPAGFSSLIFYMNIQHSMTTRLSNPVLVVVKIAIFVFFFLLAMMIRFFLF